MNYFEIMKYFVRVIKQMRAVDGNQLPLFPWPNSKLALVHLFCITNKIGKSTTLVG